MKWKLGYVGDCRGQGMLGFPKIRGTNPITPYNGDSNGKENGK